MLPTGSSVAVRQTAKVWGAVKTVRMISLLSSTLRWGGQPAAGPTSGSLAYANRLSASVSRHGRSVKRSV